MNGKNVKFAKTTDKTDKLKKRVVKVVNREKIDDKTHHN